MCAGQAVDREDYPNLFRVIGTTYNVGGEEETQFRIPDLRGYVVAGTDNMGGEAAGHLTSFAATTLGAKGGVQEVALTVDNLPSHNHTLTDPGHAHSVSDPTHTHSVYDPGHTHSHNAAALVQSSTGGGAFAINAYSGASINAAVTGISNYAAATGVSVNAAGTGMSIQNTGSGVPHSVIQPTIVLNHIIKV